MSHTLDYYERLSDDQLLMFMRSSNEEYRRLATEAWRRRTHNRAVRSQNALNAINALVNQTGNRVVQSVQTQGVQNSEIITALRRQNETLQQSINAARQSVNEMQEEYDRRIRSLQTEQAQQMQTLRIQMDQERITAANALQQLEEDNKVRTQAAVRAVTEDVQRRIGAVRNEMNAQIAAQQDAVNHLQSDFEALVSHISNDTEARNRRIQQARDYLEAARAVISETDRFNEENQHSWQADRRDELLQMEQDTVSDINNHADQVAMTDGRDLFRNALEYRSNVIAEEQRWQIEMIAADNAVDAAEAAMELSRQITVSAEDDDGNTVTETIDVDYWTCGDLTRINRNLVALRGLMDQPELTHEQLLSISELAENYRDQIEQARLFALQARQFSYDREGMLEAAVDSVIERLGNVHQVWQENYADDERLGRRVYLEADTGERIVLTAEPVVRDGKIRNEVRYEILSTGYTVHSAADANQFTNILYEALRDVEGMELSAPTCTCVPRPAEDHGQSNPELWKRPSKEEADAARRHVTPERPALPAEQQLLPERQPGAPQRQGV